MIEGLKETALNAENLNIPFRIISGRPTEEIPNYVNKTKSAALITDFSPLKQSRLTNPKIAQEIKIPFYEVDAHNIIPCWQASDKKEYAAWTFRKKVNKKLNEYLINFPKVEVQDPIKQTKSKKIDWAAIQKQIQVKKLDYGYDKSNLKSGNKKAWDQFDEFLSSRINEYDQLRNDPNKKVISNLSPYLHFGQISAQAIALELQNRSHVDRSIKSSSKDAFWEQLVVRKELSDNFCYYEGNYDNFKGFPDWAKKTLNEHRNDPREYIYSVKELESAKTHDNLWNAAQKQMIITGKMHGYMRMYWGKKILEWSRTPEVAIKNANYLNNKYELDGRDPNGYTGIAWCIGGVHDRAWPERKIFGKIRYMNYNGAKRKFDTNKYIDTIN
jgi:deoxyribodipyrimidine photo-lyase